MSVRYRHVLIFSVLLGAALADGKRAEAGLTYSFHGTGTDASASGTIQTNILPAGPGPITILPTDIDFVSVLPPPGVGPGGPVGGTPRSAFISGSLTTTPDLLSLASGRMQLAFGTPGEIAAALFVYPTGASYAEDFIPFDFQLTGTWIRSDATAVPEPSSLITAVIGCALALGWRCRRVLGRSF